MMITVTTGHCHRMSIEIAREFLETLAYVGWNGVPYTRYGMYVYISTGVVPDSELERCR